jgi:hypothetical protein
VEKLGAQPRRVASFYIGRRYRGKLLYGGKIESGYTLDEAQKIREALDPFIRKDSPLDEAIDKPKARWVEPVVEAEIDYRSRPMRAWSGMAQSRACGTTLPRSISRTRPGVVEAKSRKGSIRRTARWPERVVALKRGAVRRPRVRDDLAREARAGSLALPGTPFQRPARLHVARTGPCTRRAIGAWLLF